MTKKAHKTELKAPTEAIIMMVYMKMKLSNAGLEYGDKFASCLELARVQHNETAGAAGQLYRHQYAKTMAKLRKAQSAIESFQADHNTGEKLLNAMGYRAPTAEELAEKGAGGRK